MRITSRVFAFSWALALVFYVIEYAARSAPGVMLPQLQQAFGQDGSGVGNILASYYYTYSLMSLVAGLALDRLGAKHVVAIGAAVLAAGCMLFVVANPASAYVARLLQGTGSAFAFTGAVYLASRAFPASTLATAIGLTQCMGMLGGSAGQFVVGPLIQHGTPWGVIWIVLGLASLAIAGALAVVTPRNETKVSPRRSGSLLAPYAIVLRNPQSYLCGLVAGLLFVPTTIGAMTWGVAFFQIDRQESYQHAVMLAAAVPLGWVFGCPLLGWIADRTGRRKPTLIGGALVMLVFTLQVTFAPNAIPNLVSLFVIGVASGAAMIPYSIIKEVNPDEVKGCATGAINFLTFGVTSLIGPAFGEIFGRTLSANGGRASHFVYAGTFWGIAIALAVAFAFALRETGAKAAARTQPRGGELASL